MPDLAPAVSVTIHTAAPAGACLLGPTDLRRAEGEACPEACIAPAPEILASTLQPHGAALGLVEP